MIFQLPYKTLWIYVDMSVRREERLNMPFLPAVSKKIQNNLATYNVKPRPLAGPGVWSIFLLPGTVIVSRFKYIGTSEVYKLSSDLSLGLLIAGVILILAIYLSNHKKKHNFNSGMIFPFVLTSFRLHFLHERGLIFSALCGLLISYAFSSGFVILMKACPFCFTFGEAVILTQAVILFLFSSIENLYMSWYRVPELDMDIATTISQVGLLGIFAICATLYYIPGFRSTGPFYGVVAGVVFLFVIPCLHLLLRRSPLVWIVLLIWTDDLVTVWLVGYWVVCVAAAAVAVTLQVCRGQRASTSVRKSFHLLAVAVYLPGLVNACCLLYLASAVVLALFFMLELMRLLKVSPLGSLLQEGFAVYADEKDAGNLALTPIYLLSGCSLPLWLHPMACAHPGAFLPLCSGLLAVGVGDTLASSVGSRFGRHKWPGTDKTIEGTIACAVGQIAAVMIMNVVGVVDLTGWVMATLLVGIALTSIVEAKTDQVDNLVLPLVNFLVL